MSSNLAVGIQTRLSGVFGNTINENVSYGLDGFDATGYANNILLLNNNNGVQAINVSPAHPNVCPGCP